MQGQACRKGEAKSTHGTGAFILLNTASTNYALEGSITIAGASVQWLRDSLGIISTASEIEELAAKVDSSGGAYFVPAFNGLFAPCMRFQVKEVLDSMHKDAGEKGEVFPIYKKIGLISGRDPTVRNELHQLCDNNIYKLLIFN
ncbi:hypothetical protein PVL29_011941 [Vitis rotundifolia]|uniref:Carbohydrate kinase FGGY C-terminal domain-containing protein n=1 Tax=Vitis rotundifolia TaxID=103349 RepID=A0AA38ZQP9_VITRO|nr:hypothetical protein PVL29_011941 [Vitis rotundifolia]